MSSETQAPLKRGRTSASKNREFESPSEELSHVASLVERRRVQNRISQRNYRNKIRNRLEKLEAMVESNKANESPSVQSPSVSEPMESQPSTTHKQEETLRDSPTRAVPQTCICTFCDAELLGLSGEDFESGCSCGGVDDMHQSLSDSMSPFSTFVDTTSPNSLFTSLPSPVSLHCSMPSTASQEDFLQLGGVSTASSLSDHDTNSRPHGREASLDQPTTPPMQQPYDRSSFPFHVPMGYQMIPMSYTAAASHAGCAAQDRNGQQPWTSAPMTYSPGIRPALPSTSVQHFMFVPTSIIMVPVQHAMLPQEQSHIPPQNRSGP